MLGRGERGKKAQGRDVHEIEISSPGSMSRYALIAMLTPARENMTKAFGLHAWLILWVCCQSSASL
jgi:hypothetical protein